MSDSPTRERRSVLSRIPVVVRALWRYLGGAGPPASTAATRRRWRRAHAVDRRLWPATAVTGLLYGLTLCSFSVFTNLWQPVPPEAVAAIPGPTMPLFALGATGMGLLARLTGSIVPGIVVHILVDAGVLTWVWLRPEGLERFLAAAATAPTGDPALRIAGGVALALAAATAASFLWLHRARKARASKTAPHAGRED